MSEIPLYNALTKLGLEPEEAERAVADVASAKDVVTKGDLKAGLAEVKEAIAQLETRLYLRIVVSVGVIVSVIGLVIKFL